MKEIFSSEINKLKNIFEKNIQDLNSINRTDITPQGILPKTGGTWIEKIGSKTEDTYWKPNKDMIPDPENGKNGNPEKKTWGQILEPYNTDTITFKDGIYPDFTPFAESEVKIDDFTTDRRKNFMQADTKQAEQWNIEGKDGRTDWNPDDVSQWRKDNNYTWHECEDCETLQLVPTEIHNNIPHEGGISVAKKMDKNQTT